MATENLLSSRRFAAIFWTQLLGAMNDNIFKNALVILIAYRAYSLGGLAPDQMVALCGGVFILPFFLFSSLSGQLADKYPKTTIVVAVKVMEVLIMLLGSWGFLCENIYLLFAALFGMGLHSTIFGPVKYSILPELVAEDALVQANALVEMGTFIAILLGTIVGGVLIALRSGASAVTAAVLAVALLGLLASLFVPKLPAVSPDSRIDVNLFRSTRDVLAISRQVPLVFISVLAISWFWFFGAALLSIFPIYVKDVLHGNETVVSLFLAIFSVGVAVGSILCERFSRRKVELGLVLIGSLGISGFTLLLYLLGAPASPPSALLTITELLRNSHFCFILFSLTGLSIMSGFFIVPLYTLLQTHSDRRTRSCVIAANNILNALFMVVASLMLMGMFAREYTVIDVFAVLLGLNLLVSLYICLVAPHFLERFRLLLRVKKSE